MPDMKRLQGDKEFLLYDSKMVANEKKLIPDTHRK
jgi:hypothetical protein